jgi:hypothetical protein
MSDATHLPIWSGFEAMQTAICKNYVSILLVSYLAIKSSNKTKVIHKRKKVKLCWKDRFNWCFNGLIIFKLEYRYPDKAIQINTVPDFRSCQKCLKTIQIFLKRWHLMLLFFSGLLDRVRLRRFRRTSSDRRFRGRLCDRFRPLLFRWRDPDLLAKEKNYVNLRDPKGQFF